MPISDDIILAAMVTFLETSNEVSLAILLHITLLLTYTPHHAYDIPQTSYSCITCSSTS